jgi:uncharacterized surface protein with fasciclin (FAS1) repeats
MKKFIARISPIATAVGLAFGAGTALSQQPGQEQEEPQSAIEQRSNANADEQYEREQQQPSSQRTEQSESRDTGSSDFAQLAEENSDLSKFVEGVETAGLADALSSGTKYTIFAPTDEALESEDFDSLLEPENREELVALLRAHIVADDVDRELAGNISQARTIDGGNLGISMKDEKLMVGDAEAIEAEGFDIASLRVYKVDHVLGEGMPGDAGRRQAANRRSPSEPDRSALGGDVAEPGIRN